jgi:hypothetical protein
MGEREISPEIFIPLVFLSLNTTIRQTFDPVFQSMSLDANRKSTHNLLIASLSFSS